MTSEELAKIVKTIDVDKIVIQLAIFFIRDNLPTGQFHLQVHLINILGVICLLDFSLAMLFYHVLKIRILYVLCHLECMYQSLMS